MWPGGCLRFMRVLLADGAMGTELMARVPGLSRPAQLNLDAPELVRGLHLEYLAAGAELVLANTLMATPEEAAAGVQLAREAVAFAVSGAAAGVEREPPLRGDIPCGAAHPPARSPGSARNPVGREPQVLVAASVAAEPAPSAELIAALDEADAIMLETVTSVAALQAAVRVLKGRWRKAIMATLSFGRDGTLEGRTPEEVAKVVEPMGLDAFGYGCGFGLEHARGVMRALREAAPEAVLIATPNVGVPPATPSTPEEAAGWAEDMAELGVQIIGTCCGSSPAHTRAIADRLEAQLSEPEEDESDGS